MPDELARLVHDEGVRDALLLEGLHVPAEGLAAFILGDDVVHPVAQALDELADLLGIGLVRHAHDHEPLVSVLLRDLAQVGNARAAGRAPGRPELDHVDRGALPLLEVDRFPLDPLRDLERGRGVAELPGPEAAHHEEHGERREREDHHPSAMIGYLTKVERGVSPRRPWARDDAPGAHRTSPSRDLPGRKRRRYRQIPAPPRRVRSASRARHPIARLEAMVCLTAGRTPLKTPSHSRSTGPRRRWLLMALMAGLGALAGFVLPRIAPPRGGHARTLPVVEAPAPHEEPSVVATHRRSSRPGPGSPRPARTWIRPSRDPPSASTPRRRSPPGPTPRGPTWITDGPAAPRATQGRRGLDGPDPGRPHGARRSPIRPPARAIARAFYLDIHEVTWGRFRKFAAESGIHPPPAPPWGSEDDHPVVNVIWKRAVAYAAWAQGRLPTEAEWEHAAQGGAEGRTYPWGETWEAGRANDGSSGLQRTAPVGSYPRGASRWGCHDLAGNAWEWCLHGYDPSFLAKRRMARPIRWAPWTPTPGTSGEVLPPRGGGRAHLPPGVPGADLRPEERRVPGARLPRRAARQGAASPGAQDRARARQEHGRAIVDG